MNLKPANPSLSQAKSKELATSIKLRPHPRNEHCLQTLSSTYSPHSRKTPFNLNKLLFLNRHLTHIPASNFHTSTPKMKAFHTLTAVHSPSNLPRRSSPPTHLKDLANHPTLRVLDSDIIHLKPQPKPGKTPIHWERFPHEKSLSGLPHLFSFG